MSVIAGAIIWSILMIVCTRLPGGSGNCTEVLAHGDICIPSCNTGYSPSGASSCDLGVLSAASCQPNPCTDMPVAPMNGSDSTCSAAWSTYNGNLPSGLTCLVLCDTGYTVSGPTVCFAGTLTMARCDPNPCAISAPPGNGSMGTCPSQITSGATCQPNCDAGFTVSGLSLCFAGTLTAARCIPNPCLIDSSVVPANGGFGTCSGLLSSGQSCQPICNTGYTVSGNLPCTAGVLGRRVYCTPNPCDISMAPRNGSIGTCSRLVPSGATCLPMCDAGFILSGVSSCLAGVATRAACVQTLDCVGAWTDCTADCSPKRYVILRNSTGGGAKCTVVSGALSPCRAGEGACPALVVVTSADITVPGAVDLTNFLAGLLALLRQQSGSSADLDVTATFVQTAQASSQLTGINQASFNRTRTRLQFRQGVASTSGATINETVILGVRDASRLGNGRRRLQTISQDVTVDYSITTTDQGRATNVARQMSQLDSFSTALLSNINAAGDALNLTGATASSPAFVTSIVYSVLASPRLGSTEIASLNTQFSSMLSNTTAITGVANAARVEGTVNITSVTVRDNALAVPAATQPTEEIHEAWLTGSKLGWLLSLLAVMSLFVYYIVGRLHGKTTVTGPRGRVDIHVVRAKGLAAMDGSGFSDPFVKLSWAAGWREKRTQQKVYRTKVVKRTLDPEWLEETFYMALCEEEVLTVEVWDWDRLTKDDPMGCVHLHANTDVMDGEEHWHALQPMKGVKNPQGELLLRCEYKPPWKPFDKGASMWKGIRERWNSGISRAEQKKIEQKRYWAQVAARMRKFDMFASIEETQLQSVWKRVDADGSGLLDADEVRQVMKDMGMELDDAEFAATMKQIDRDGSGELDYDEFLNWWRKQDTARQMQQLDEASMEEARLQAVWKELDTDGSGFLDAGEVRQVIKNMGMEMTDAEFAATMAQIDVDGSGELDYDEFWGWWRKQEAQLRAVWKRVDADGSGLLDADEVRQVMKNVGMELDDAEFAAIMAQIDVDGSGELDYDEFIVWWRKQDAETKQLASPRKAATARTSGPAPSVHQSGNAEVPAAVVSDKQDEVRSPEVEAGLPSPSIEQQPQPSASSSQPVVVVQVEQERQQRSIWRDRYGRVLQHAHNGSGESDTLLPPSAPAPAPLPPPRVPMDEARRRRIILRGAESLGAGHHPPMVPARKSSFPSIVLSAAHSHAAIASGEGDIRLAAPVDT
jgi:Ca2+-binding EF-hand superfamily protein